MNRRTKLHGAPIYAFLLDSVKWLFYGVSGHRLVLERSFRILEVWWSRWTEVLLGLTVGMLGAFWTFHRLAIFRWCPITNMRQQLLTRWTSALKMILLRTQVAHAHTNRVKDFSFWTGRRHPIPGMNAMIAVGLWGAQLNAPAI